LYDIQYPDNTKFDQQDDGAFEAKAEMNFLRDCLSSSKGGETDRERRKKSIKTKLLSLASDVDGCNNDNALQQLEKSINAAYSLFISVCEHGNKHLPTPKESAPPNKNIKPQQRFFSTKKKTRRANVRLVKPTKEEKLQITENWQTDEQADSDPNNTDKDFTTDNIDSEGLHRVKTVYIMFCVSTHAHICLAERNEIRITM